MKRAQEAERCLRLFSTAKYSDCLAALAAFEALLEGQRDPRVRRPPALGLGCLGLGALGCRGRVLCAACVLWVGELLECLL